MKGTYFDLTGKKKITNGTPIIDDSDLLRSSLRKEENDKVGVGEQVLNDGTFRGL